MSGRVKTKGLEINMLVTPIDDRTKLMASEMKCLPHTGEMDQVTPEMREQIHRGVDSFLDRLNEKWNYIMKETPVAAHIVSQVLGHLPPELEYLLDENDPVTKLMDQLNTKWVGMAKMLNGPDGDIMANQYLEETLHEIEALRPGDPIVSFMRETLAQGKKHVANTPVKTTYLN